MFTGIITDMGVLLAMEGGADNLRLSIGTRYDSRDIALGASIACNGICLTVVDKGALTAQEAEAFWSAYGISQDTVAGVPPHNWFAVDASPHTQAVTTVAGWQVGQRLNLERALKLGDEMGGHLVTGHVDGLAAVISATPQGESVAYVIEAPAALSPFIAAKGSVTLDGVSLTVTEVKGTFFGVTVIPHTLSVTSWAYIQPGSLMNLEVDLLARYVRRMMEARGPHAAL